MPDPKKLGSGFCEKGLAGPGLQTLPAMSGSHARSNFFHMHTFRSGSRTINRLLENEWFFDITLANAHKKMYSLLVEKHQTFILLLPLSIFIGSLRCSIEIMSKWR